METKKTNRGGARPGAGRKRKGHVPIMITIHPTLVARLDAVTDNRSAFIAELLEKALPAIEPDDSPK